MHEPPYSPKDEDTIRELHHESSHDIIWESVDTDSSERITCGLEDCIQPDYVKFIALLARYHRMGKPGILSKKIADEDQLEIGRNIRVRFWLP